MKKYGYVRVSTKEQNEQRQLDIMKKYGIRKSDIFIDKLTGKNFERPSYQALKEELETGDILLITSVDRLGRNKQQSLKELRELKDKGVVIMIENIPTTLIAVDEKNKGMIEMINNILIEVYTTLAEEELKMIKERQEQGVKAMKVDEKGRKVSLKTNRVAGRPNKQENLSKEQIRYIKAWISKNIKLSDCIKFTGLSKATLYRIKDTLKEE
ncbi:MAG: recombinase family protein [Filifactoraceae bacterium]